MEEEKGRKQKKHRIDRKHRFPLRIDEVDHNEIDALAFRHNMSQNALYCFAIQWALKADAFRHELQMKFPRDERRGYFTYNVDTRVERPRRLEQ